MVIVRACMCVYTILFSLSWNCEERGAEKVKAAKKLPSLCSINPSFQCNTAQELLYCKTSNRGGTKEIITVPTKCYVHKVFSSDVVFMGRRRKCHLM